MKNEIEKILDFWQFGQWGNFVDSYKTGGKIVKDVKEIVIEQILSLFSNLLDSCERDIAENIYNWLSVTEPNKNILSVHTKAKDIIKIIKDKLEAK